MYVSQLGTHEDKRAISNTKAKIIEPCMHMVNGIDSESVLLLAWMYSSIMLPRSLFGLLIVSVQLL